MKIIVTDGYVENPGDLSWAPLEALGEVTYYDRIGLSDEDETIRRIGDAEIAVINKAPVTRKVIDNCPNLKFIAVMATGYNVVDVVYAKEKGIPVCNVPNYGGYSVSQFTIALMLEACLHIGHHDRTVHEPPRGWGCTSSPTTVPSLRPLRIWGWNSWIWTACLPGPTCWPSRCP